MLPVDRFIQRLIHGGRSVIEFLDELFRERELILRSQGRVHFIPLTRRLQISAFLVAMAVGVWGIGMTLMSTVKSGVIQVKNDEIREARVAYEDLFEEVLSYQKKVASVTSNLRESQESLLSQVNDAVNAADAAKKRAGKPSRKTTNLADNKSVSELDATDKPSVSLRSHLNDIDHKVLQMTETNVLLEGSLKKIKTELKLAGDERDQIIKTRTKLRDRVADLEEQLIRSRTDGAYLERRVAELSDTLSLNRESKDQVEDQRDALASRVDGLESGIKTARARAKLAEVDLEKVLDRLEKTTGSEGIALNGSDRPESDELDGQIDHDGATVKLRQRTVALIRRLNDLHAAQGNVLDRLGERTVKNIEEAERLITMTGLELDKVLGRATRMASGQGGPLFEVASTTEDVEGLPGSVSEIDTQLTRWAGLRSLLKRVPLVSPVDFYHQASPFGLRRDPFTKKKAMHYGVDLAGWGGAPVFTTAPGKVVFAGRKGRYGKMIEIDHGYGIRTRYGHLRKVLVKRGQEVGHRHRIGLLGSTGRSTGPHVHYEVRFDGKPMNPEKFIKAGRYVFKG
jgi:murein DD-endopeptidase MepM/ murein hydrolase activator NlpD